MRRDSGTWQVRRLSYSCIVQCPIGEEGLHCEKCRTPLGVGRMMNQLTLTVRVFTKKYYAVCYSDYSVLHNHMKVPLVKTSSLML